MKAGCRNQHLFLHHLGLKHNSEQAEGQSKGQTVVLASALQYKPFVAATNVNQ